MSKFFIAVWIVLYAVIIQAAPGFHTMSSQDAANFLERIRTRSRSISTIACRFDQDKHLEMFEDVLRMRGWCYIEKPDKIRWEYITPLRKVIILHGEHMTVYHLNEDGTKSPGNQREQQYLKVVYGYIMGFFRGEFRLRDDNFKISVKAGTQENLLEMSSHASLKKYISRIEIYVSRASLQITKIKIFEPRGDYTEIRLHNLQIRKKFHPQLFSKRSLHKFDDAFR